MAQAVSRRPLKWHITQWLNLKFGHDQFMSQPFEFTIHSIIRLYVILATESVIK
jgi:hypothetical protein